MFNQENHAYHFQIVQVGNSSVGKSSLILKFSEQLFTEYFFPTIGIDFKIRNLHLQGKLVKLQIWDTAGQERFRNIAQSYYKGAHGIILIYNITDKESFEDIENWLSEVEKYISEDTVKLLVGNKSDLEFKRQVTYEEGKQLSERLNMKFIETSAKDNLNVEKVFITLAQEMKQKQKSQNNPPPQLEQ